MIKAVATISLSTIRDIASVWRFYCLQPSTAAAPSTPDAATTAAFIKKASKTNADLSSTWVHTEPTYTTGSTNSLYTLDLTIYTDDTYSYSTVCLSSSYEAAKAAYNKAVQAQTAADSGAKTATNYVTEQGASGQILVHPEGDTKNAVLIGQDVQIIRNGTVVATYSDAVKIGNANSGHTEISANEQKFIADDGTIVLDMLRDTSRVYTITETAYTEDTEGQSGSYVNKAKLSYPMYKLVGIYARNGADITADVTYTYNSTTYTLENMSNADSDGDPMDMKHYIFIKYVPDIDNVTLSVGRYPLADNRGKLLVLGNGVSASDRRNVLSVDMLGNITAASVTTTGLVNKMQAGRVTVTPSGSQSYPAFGTPDKFYKGTKPVTFGTAFSSDPVVTVTPSSTVPNKCAVAVSDVSTTGFTINLYRTNTTETTVMWQAMEDTQ